MKNILPCMTPYMHRDSRADHPQQFLAAPRTGVTIMDKRFDHMLAAPNRRRSPWPGQSLQHTQTSEVAHHENGR
ncbi:hypothetical protein A9Q95_09025 [Rhodobacterales bacterium 59_46_T64]|nr:hypothetical protein A9Q95_09025 [Rhodobacterales bacterium 59_46_T64]